MNLKSQFCLYLKTDGIGYSNMISPFLNYTT